MRTIACVKAWRDYAVASSKLLAVFDAEEELSKTLPMPAASVGSRLPPDRCKSRRPYSLPQSSGFQRFPPERRLIIFSWQSVPPSPRGSAVYFFASFLAQRGRSVSASILLISALNLASKHRTHGPAAKNA